MTEGLECDDVHPIHLVNLMRENEGQGDDAESESGSEDVEDEDEENEQLEVAEDVPLFLPSYLTENERHRLGWEDLATQELELRKGQANDCLEALRVALAHKALMYRVNVSHKIFSCPQADILVDSAS